MLKYNSNEILDYIIKNRRYLHSIPELAEIFQKLENLL